MIYFEFEKVCVIINIIIKNSKTIADLKKSFFDYKIDIL